MRVYGNQIEPGGMELDTDEVECPECGGAAKYRTWNAIELGSIIIDVRRLGAFC